MLGAKVDANSLQGMMGNRPQMKEVPTEFSSMFSPYNANLDSKGFGNSDMFAGMDAKSISGFDTSHTPTQKPLTSSQTYQVFPSYSANEVNQQVSGLNFNSRR